MYIPLFSARYRPAAGLAALFALWTPGLAFGIHKMMQYAYTPGRPAATAPEWPANRWMAAPAGRFALVMFVHPQCPCSRASIAELAGILAHEGRHTEAAVFFFAPAAENRDWVHSDSWRDAAAIAGVRIFEDPEGAAAKRFGAFTSGETLLFGTNGRLAFHGGITSSRGHAGDSAGREAVLAILGGKTPELKSAPVFGCSIRGSD